MKSNYWLNASDNTEIYVQSWQTKSKPKALVQVAHGMVEHIDRYDSLANYLVENGITVFGNDHRGHGKTGEKTSSLGFLANTDGFERVVKDLKEVTSDWVDKYPDTPIFLLGHSFGSFLSRRYIQKYSENLNGVIVIGTGYQSPLILTLARAFAKYHIKRKGQNTPSDFFNNVIFGGYKKSIRAANTDFDWLTRDQEQVKHYINDPQTGFVPSTTFFYDMFHGMLLIENQQNIKDIRKDLPILLLSGERDPVTNFGKAPRLVKKYYQKAGINNVENISYKDARHELLNETNRQEVYKDINDWINNYL